MHKKGARNHVPDALSREFEDDYEVSSFFLVSDPWYARRIEEICQRPSKFASWWVEDGLLYKYTRALEEKWQSTCRCGRTSNGTDNRIVSAGQRAAEAKGTTTIDGGADARLEQGQYIREVLPCPGTPLRRYAGADDKAVDGNGALLVAQIDYSTDPLRGRSVALPRGTALEV